MSLIKACDICERKIEFSKMDYISLRSSLSKAMSIDICLPCWDDKKNSTLINKLVKGNA